MVEEVSPPEAWKILNEDSEAVLLDVRSFMEFEYVGHPPGAVFVSLKEPPGWETRAEFVDETKQALKEKFSDKNPEDLTVLAMCRSGARSMLAAELLLQAGFTKVINVAEGFEGDKNEQSQRNSINGWRYHGLPWLQS